MRFVHLLYAVQPSVGHFRDVGVPIETTVVSTLSGPQKALINERTKLEVFCLATLPSDFLCGRRDLLSSATLEPIRVQRNAHDGFSDVAFL
jgi:hypothetical protein